MLVASPKYRRPLNSNQIRVLELCYKFRFVSVDLLSLYLKKNRSSIYERLFVLEQQGYVRRRYDKSYRQRGRPASYYLASKGIRYLRENTKLNQTVLRNMYKSKGISDEHVDHCLQVLATYIALSKQTKEAFEIFTKYELADFEFFIRPLPDLYLRRKKSKQGTRFDYQLDIFDPNLPFWVIKKRLRAYENHSDEAELDQGETYPYILFVCPTERLEQRIQALLENFYSDFEVYTTTSERILSPGSNSSAVWREVFEEEYIGL